MYLAIIVLPILSSIVSGLFGREVGVSGAQLITCLSVTITTTIGFIEVGLNNIGNIVTIIGICLLIGAMAKSSQIGLYVWLFYLVSAYSKGVYGLVNMLKKTLGFAFDFSSFSEEKKHHTSLNNTK